MKEDIKRIKETYVKGMRVRLVKMDDEQAPPIGMEGTIRGVYAIGSVLVMWDTGSKLNVILEDDEIEIIKENNDSKIYTVYSSEADISFIMEDRNNSIAVDISHILGNLITVIFDYQILRKPLKILSL